MNLTATAASSWRWRATQTEPIPPWARGRSSRYLPAMTLPGARVIMARCFSRRELCDEDARPFGGRGERALAEVERAPVMPCHDDVAALVDRERLGNLLALRAEAL